VFLLKASVATQNSPEPIFNNFSSYAVRDSDDLVKRVDHREPQLAVSRKADLFEKSGNMSVCDDVSSKSTQERCYQVAAHKLDCHQEEAEGFELIFHA